MKNTRLNQHNRNKILIIGSMSFAKNTHDFLRQFGVNALFFKTTCRNNFFKMIMLLNYIYILMKVDVVYTVGYFTPYSPFYLIARLLKKNIIVHWIGSEVLELKKSHYWPLQGSFSVTKNLVTELARNKIYSSWLPLFFPLFYENELDQNEYPTKHGLLFYLVDDQEDFYGLRYLIFLANKFKTINFYVIGSSRMVFPNVNIINMGFLSDVLLNELFKKITIYVRITQHDGLSHLIIRSLSLGKVVVTNTNHPFVLNFDQLTNSDDDLFLMMRQIIIKKPKINQDAINYINEFYDHSSQFDRYFNAFKNIGIQL